MLYMKLVWDDGLLVDCGGSGEEGERGERGTWGGRRREEEGEGGNRNPRWAQEWCLLRLHITGISLCLSTISPPLGILELVSMIVDP